MFELETILNHKTFLLFACLFLIALTAFLSESSGIINISMEGQLITAVFFFTLANFLLKKSLNSEVLIYVLSFLISLITVVIFTFIFAFLTVTLRMNEILVALALNIIIGGLASFLIILFRDAPNFSQKDYIILYTNPNFNAYLFKDFPIIIHLFVGFVIASIIYFFIRSTTTGLRIRACGKNEKVVRLSGLNPEQYRYIALMIGAFLMAFAGLFFIESQDVFTGAVYGYGYIGLGLLNLSNKNIPLIAIFTFIFVVLQTFAASNAGDLYVELYKTISYIIPIVALSFYGCYRYFFRNKILNYWRR